MIQRINETTGTVSRPVMVDSADLVGIAELAGALGVTRQAICNWAVRHSDFPKPVVTLASGPVYAFSQVVAWHKSRKHVPKNLALPA